MYIHNFQNEYRSQRGKRLYYVSLPKLIVNFNRSVSFFISFFSFDFFLIFSSFFNFFDLNCVGNPKSSIALSDGCVRRLQPESSGSSSNNCSRFDLRTFFFEIFTFGITVTSDGSIVGGSISVSKKTFFNCRRCRRPFTLVSCFSFFFLMVVELVSNKW